ncbi:MBL fold metallo-hydrolase [Pseudonocardia spinosispora]|uniref:MBL fold metallo-hydrolase n=1 Tax=Pseudonocardia spinosispora TaxID=103441 RepID=UPI00048E1DD4|nr:MBL fold metallo-hydrolase [Pseudonocardia spinosispora]
MRTTVVGSGDAFGSGGRFQTCIALDRHTLIDCGGTSLTALRQQGFDPNAITTVVISHLHADHFGGLPFLILDGQFRRRTSDLTVIGPPSTGSRLAEAMEVSFPGSSTVRRRFEVRVVEHVEATTQHIGSLAVTPYEVRHAAGAPAYALRVDDGESHRSVAYSGDTEWTDALIEASDGADVFLCEGYTPRPVRWHLDLDTLAANRHRLTCERLVLTHLSPTALAADLSAWQIAHDGLVL